MQKTTTEYSGRDNLEIMAEAHNYSQFLLNLIEKHLSPTGRTLDFGAGLGVFDDPLKRKHWTIDCVEVDPTLVAELKKKDYVVWDTIDKIPNEHYTNIFSLNVFEHIEHDVAIWEALRDKLSPGGQFLVYVPAFPLLWSSMDTKVGHHRRYRRLDLQTKVQSAGYQIKTLRYVDTVGFFVSLIYKFIGSRDGAINPTALKIFDRWIFPLNKVLDPVFGKLLGKNVLAVLVKDAQ